MMTVTDIAAITIDMITHFNINLPLQEDQIKEIKLMIATKIWITKTIPTITQIPLILIVKLLSDIRIIIIIKKINIIILDPTIITNLIKNLIMRQGHSLIDTVRCRIRIINRALGKLIQLKLIK